MALAGAGAPRADLDVSIPPGSTLEWGRSFPAASPAPGPLFPAAPRPGETREGRTRALPAAPARGVSSTFGLLRILTWDLAAHLAWVQGGWPELAGPRTGAAAHLPEASEPLYWISVSTLLRRLLHPALVPGPEVTAHLVELGEPVLPLLDLAGRQRGLEALCDDVRLRIAPGSSASRQPLPQRDARGRMLASFVLAELVAAHPYDPDAGFGARLFLMGGELEEQVRAHTAHPDPFTRRNAVQALGRYGTKGAAEALLQLAASTHDDVVLVRALAGLPDRPGGLDVQPLVERLAREQDPMRRAALAGALGRLARREALDAVLALAQEARRANDSDLLVTAVAALARIPASAQDRELARFLASLERAARTRPANFREPAPASPVTADLPGSTHTRGDLLAQLATLARARLDLDEQAMGDVLALRGPGGATGRGRFGSGALGQLLPPAQLLWLETAARCGPRGEAALAEIARDGGTDPSARAVALLHLPRDERAAISIAILEQPSSLELAARALELLSEDGHARTEALCRGILTRHAALPPGSGSPEERQLALVALRTLAARGALDGDLLLAFEPLLAAPGRLDDSARRARLHARALELVLAARRASADTALEAPIRALVEYARSIRASPQLELVAPEVPAARIRAQLSDLRRRPRADEALLTATAEALVAILVGHAAPQRRGAGTRIDPPVPLEPELLLALGRLASFPALALLERLAATPDSPQRAAACLALALAAHRPAAPTLARALFSPDPFTRLAAAESLRHLTGLEEPIDWYAAPAPERAAAAERLHARLPR